MISPNDTFTLYVDDDVPVDQRKPDHQRPGLVFRYGSDAGVTAYNERIDAAHRGGLTIEESRKEIRACLESYLVRTQNLADFETGEPTDDYARALTTADVRAIAIGLPLRMELTEADRKNSESPSPSSAAASAESAADGPAAA